MVVLLIINLQVLSYYASASCRERKTKLTIHGVRKKQNLQSGANRISLMAIQNILVSWGTIILTIIGQIVVSNKFPSKNDTQIAVEKAAVMEDLASAEITMGIK